MTELLDIRNFAIAASISVVLIVLTIAAFYEIMRGVWLFKERFISRPRYLIHVMVAGVFAAHTVCVWLYGVTYWALDKFFDFGELRGELTDHFFEYIYFSAITYTSVGFGDVFVHGPLRLITGVEALNGLLLIGWSVTYTYFATEKYIQVGRRK